MHDTQTQITYLKQAANKLVKQGKYRSAIKHYFKALRQNKQDAEILNMLAITLKLLNKHFFALKLIKKAHELSPNSIVILQNLAIMLLSENKTTEAKSVYQHILTLQPDLKDAAIQLCRIYNRELNPKQGLDLITKQLKHQPNDTNLQVQQGLQLAFLHEYQAAFKILSAQYTEYQNNETFLFSLAVCSYNLNNFFEAATLFKKCIEKNANKASYWNYLGVTQKHLKNRNYLEEIKCFRKAITLENHNLSVCQNMANTLISADKLIMAEKILDQIIAQQPDFTEALVSLGYVNQLIAKYSLAEQYYLKAIKQDVNLAGAHTNLGLLYLSLGKFKQGWDEYEWRWQHPDLNDVKANFSGTKWQGESLADKTLMIFTEQGFGDTIQFVRYLPLINKQNGKIIIECREPLVELIKTVPEIDDVVPRTESFPSYDLYIPLLSLPKLFETDIDNIPAKVPYLSVDKHKRQLWQNYFSQFDNRLKVGISWAGNPQHKHDRYRTVKPALFSQLMSDNIMLFSLQRDVDDAVCQQYGFINLANQLHDFTDTAACLSALDLLISVDTAIVHLAGALNLPVWTLLGFYCDWRWLKERVDSPWYPSMRLFRQPTRHDWQTPFKEIQQALLQERANYPACPE